MLKKRWQYGKRYGNDYGCTKVEHYEIATFGGLVQLAKTMGMDEVAEILAQTLEEIKQTNQGLTEIAENNINWEPERDEMSEQSANN